MSLKKTLLSSLVMALAAAMPKAPEVLRSPCKPFSGTFSIDAFRLYPENLDFDNIHCKLYLDANYNATVLVYDPYTQAQTTLSFDGISYNLEYHISGIDFDGRTGIMYFSANAGVPWETNGQVLTGPNKLIAYNTFTNKTLYIADIGPAITAASTIANATINGFQDQAEDGFGNSYCVVSFGSAIIKVNPKGKASVFYVPAKVNDPHIYGIGSIAAVSERKIVVADSITGTLFSMDALQKVDAEAGKLATLTSIPLNGLPAGLGQGLDAMYPPPKYCNKVLLLSDNVENAIHVLRSADGWVTAEYLGQVANDSPLAAEGGLPTSTVEIGGSIFINEEFFFDAGLFERTANRTFFPMVDITADVTALVGY